VSNQAYLVISLSFVYWIILLLIRWYMSICRHRSKWLSQSILSVSKCVGDFIFRSMHVACKRLEHNGRRQSGYAPKGNKLRTMGFQNRTAMYTFAASLLIVCAPGWIELSSPESFMLGLCSYVEGISSYWASPKANFNNNIYIWTHISSFAYPPKNTSLICI
jgi:hypothetical protein